MYEEYYGFVQPPFSLAPDPRFLYRSESHDVALQQVWQAIRRKEGFIVLAGDIGTGKTTLCRTVLEQFDPTTFTSLILNPFLTVEELLREMLLSYGVASKDTMRTGRLATASRHDLIRALHDFLLSLVPIHGSAVLIIDEAQHLSPEVLEEIRILSNLETNERKLLQIVLVGQLNLLDTLHDAKLRQLDQRISIRCLLKALNREEVEAYITHRLWVARGSTAVTFTPRAIDLVHALSGGVPRMINLIADRALMAGAAAKTDRITDPLILEAANALALPVSRGMGRRESLLRAAGGARRTILVMLVVLILGAMAYVVFVDRSLLEFFGSTTLPAAPRPVTTPTFPVVPPPPPEAILSLAPPSVAAGSFSVAVGTYDTPHQAETAEAALRIRRLPVFAIDLSTTQGIRRRLLVGPYGTRAEADTAYKSLAARFGEARVVSGPAARVP
jgi:general secretion pathway protein A